MTSQLYNFTLGSGQHVIVEVESSTAAPGGQAVAVAGRIQDAKHSMEALLSVIPEIVTPVYEAIQKSISTPQELKLEIGFKLSGELGIVIAKTQTEGNFKVTASWKQS